MSFSDDIWSIFLISKKKEQIKKEISEYTSIPDNIFYSFDEISKLLIYHNFKSYSKSIFFEEWLINDIIIPINNFILKIKNSVKNPSNNIEVYEKLSEIFVKDIKNEDLIKEIKFICQKLSPFWECEIF